MAWGASAETNHLVSKGTRTALEPLEIVVTAFAITFFFSIVYGIMCFRQTTGLSAAILLGPVLFGLLALFATLWAYLRYKKGRAMRFWYVLCPGLWLAVIFATYYGDAAYYSYIATYEEYQDLAVYVSVNPETEEGGSFMDTGRIYFVNTSEVMTDFHVAFVNGYTYCVAPILIDPDLTDEDTAVSDDGSITVPADGTVDYWSVGTDCCNTTWFGCGLGNNHPKAALRILGATVQENYRLATREWSATYGIPVKHALFFNWIQDPITTIDDLKVDAHDALWLDTLYCLITSVLVTFFAHAAMHGCGVH